MSPEAPLSVLAVSPVAEAGGAENLLLDLLVTQREGGVDVALAVLGDGPLIELAQARGLRVFTGPALSFRNPPSVVRAAGIVRKAVAAAGAHVVLASHAKGQLISRLATARDRSVGHVTQLYDPPSRSSVSTRVAARLTGARLSITEETAAGYRAMNPRLDPLVIPPGTDGDRLRRAAVRGNGDRAWTDAGLGGGATRIVMTGRLQRFKGPFDFVAVAHRVAANRPHARFLIVGPDSPIEPNLRRDLEAHIVREGLGATVALSGLLSPDDLAATVAGATILVHPAHREPFGLSVLEALVLGTPVISYATDGPSEILREGGGALVPVADVEALATAVLDALDDPARLDRWRTEAGPAASRFDLAATAAQYRRVLEEAAPARGSRR